MNCCFPFIDRSNSPEGKSNPKLRDERDEPKTPAPGSKSKEDKLASELNQNDESESPAPNQATESADPALLRPGSLTEAYDEENQRNLRVFSFSELRDATKDFKGSRKLGEGGFGSVFKGKISPSDGHGKPIVVAIKRLQLDQYAFQDHKQWLVGRKQWVAEIEFLSIFNHPNLIKLLGYCSEDLQSGKHLLLVYEYMPNKSLEDHLFSEASAPLPWKTRLEIILGAAEGLAHLHCGLKRQVIHRDIKSSNVLLDKNFQPKLSDFGVAREGPIGDRTHVTTDVVGTFGYSAPEYAETGHLTVKSDIYSFGVVLYEVLTGRRAWARNRPPMEQNLVDWVQKYLADSNRISRIIDPRLGSQYSLSAAQKIAKLADSCLNRTPKNRPIMTKVVESLKEAIQDSGGASSPEHLHPSWAFQQELTSNGNHRHRNGDCSVFSSN